MPEVMFKKNVVMIHVVALSISNMLISLVCTCPWLLNCFRAGPRKGHNSKNPKTQAWDDVQKVCRHVTCCCFASDLFVSLPLWRPWTRMKSSIVPPGIQGWRYPQCQLPSCSIVWFFQMILSVCNSWCKLHVRWHKHHTHVVPAMHCMATQH